MIFRSIGASTWWFFDAAFRLGARSKDWHSCAGYNCVRIGSVATSRSGIGYAYDLPDIPYRSSCDGRDWSWPCDLSIRSLNASRCSYWSLVEQEEVQA